jgi:hypothetical protein
MLQPLLACWSGAICLGRGAFCLELFCIVLLAVSQIRERYAAALPAQLMISGQDASYHSLLYMQL